jgi:hypothetical protein
MFNAFSKHWILLDSQSNISVFNDPSMISNICTSTEVLYARINGGKQCSTQVGDFKNLVTAWYPQYIANILSLAGIGKVCRVTMDTKVEPSMIVH